MPWKEPGDKPPREPRSGGPWGQGNPGHGGPDLGARLRKLRSALGPFGHGPAGVIALLVLAIVLWFVIGGWTVVGNQQVGVLLRFGRLEGVLQPGLHLRLPSPIDQVQIVDMGQARTVSDEVRLLTSDGQLAVVDYYVQYKVTDARAFLFGTRDANDALRNAATVAARVVVGTHTLQQLMGRTDGQLSRDLRAHLLMALTATDIGIDVTGVGIQDVQVPSEVQKAFDGIAQAREDAKAAQATAVANVARGKVAAKAQAAALETAANSERARAVADAQAGVARFDQILAQYKAAPQITRHQLWLDAMRDVFAKNRVIINTGSGSVVVQFPVTHVASPAAPVSAATSAPASGATSPASAGSVSVPLTSGPAVHGVGA